MIRSFSFLVLFLVLSAGMRAGATPVDLGQGLTYLRIPSFTADLKPVSGNGALVLDLRYTTADDQSAEKLRVALASHPTGTPLFILVSPATPSALAATITTSAALTLGPPDSVPTPKVVVHTDAATDRRAYEALEAGTPLPALISGKIEKERYDEATLVEEFKNGLPADGPGQTPAGQQTGTVSPPLPVDPTAPTAVTSDAPPKPTTEPLTDRVLQRAVNLHAALLALRPRS